MNMTQAIVATSYGGADVLEFRDITTPGPGPGQVLINVKAAGVNPIDWKLYSGAFGTDPDKLPMRLGLEISGTIAAVGAGVDGLVPGDDVIAAGQIGGYATRVIVAADQVFKKPASLSFDEAAGFLLTGQTAVHLLEATNVTEGDTVLIHGAAGGVGLLATQLAKARGATVIATASAARHDQLRGYGAFPSNTVPDCKSASARSDLWTPHSISSAPTRPPMSPWPSSQTRGASPLSPDSAVPQAMASRHSAADPARTPAPKSGLPRVPS